MYNKYIDHTLLKPDATEKQIIQLCKEAIKYDFASVCVNPHYVSLCRQLLKNKSPMICTVIGFPLGSNTTQTKIYETKNAIDNGADEIDMVINISWLKENKLWKVISEIKAIKKVCGKKILKVIVETCLLNIKNKKDAYECVYKGGANFIKTSTGFSTDGAKVEDIKLFKSLSRHKLLIKASGGIKTYKDMIQMIKAGANRIGTSRGVEIMKEINHE